MKKFLSVLFVVLMSVLAVAETVVIVQEEVAEAEDPVAQEGTALQAAADLGKASADEASVVSGSCGEKVTWKYDTSSKTLTISGEGDMTNYETPDDLPWAAYMPHITTVVIGDCIKSLSDYAFYWSSALVNVIVEARTPPLCGSFAFYSIGPDATLTVPYGRKGYYEKEFGWKNFGKNIQEKALETSGSCGENATWAYDAATKTLTIMGTGRMYDYESSAPWDRNMDDISKIVIGEGITHIGNTSFTFCAKVTSVTLPSTLESIGVDAFSCCEALTSVTIPANVTEIKEHAFDDCSALATVTVEAVKPPVLGREVFRYIASNAKFIVPAGSEAAYKADKNWQQYFKGETGISSIDAAKGKAEVKKVFRNGRLCIGNYTIAGQRVQ